MQDCSYFIADTLELLNLVLSHGSVLSQQKLIMKSRNRIQDFWIMVVIVKCSPGGFDTAVPRLGCEMCLFFSTCVEKTVGSETVTPCPVPEWQRALWKLVTVYCSLGTVGAEFIDGTHKHWMCSQPRLSCFQNHVSHLVWSEIKSCGNWIML